MIAPRYRSENPVWKGKPTSHITPIKPIRQTDAIKTQAPSATSVGKVGTIDKLPTATSDRGFKPTLKTPKLPTVQPVKPELSPAVVKPPTVSGNMPQAAAAMPDDAPTQAENPAMPLPSVSQFTPQSNHLSSLANQMVELKQALMAQPVQREASVQSGGMKNFAKFDEDAYEQMSKRLDHQYESERKSFDQQMVNQGLVPGTEAYDNALKNFEQNKSDAYDSARMSAMTYALNAQNQDFQQRATSRGLDLQDKYSSLADALGRAGLMENQRQFNAGFGFNQNQARFGNAMNLANFNEGNRRWDSSNDFNQFVTMDEINRSYNDQAYRDAVFNASRQDQQYNQLVSALTGAMPQQGAQPLDVMGAYNMNQNAAMGQYQAGMQRANANQASFNNLIGTGAMASAMFLSSRDYKENGISVDKHEMLEAVNSLDIEEWNYKGEKRRHVGAYAEDFNEAIGNETETDKIANVDAVGVLMGAVQALTERVEELEGVVVP